MGRRGRPKKRKQITYDSKETKFVLAVLLFVIGVLAFLSYLIGDNTGVFGFLRSLYGGVTWLLALFFLNWALSLFGASYFLTTRKSLLSQILVTTFWAVIIASSASPLLLREQSYAGDHGGIIGYELASFSQNYFLLNMTNTVAWVFFVLLLPSFFSQSIAEFFGNLFRHLRGILGVLFGQNKADVKNAENRQAQAQIQEQQGKTAMFGDFRNKQQAEAAAAKAEQQQKPKLGLFGKAAPKEDVAPPDFLGIDNKPMRAGGSVAAANLQGNNPAIVTTEAGEGPIVQTELKYPNWKLPPLTLLDPLPKIDPPKEDVKNNSTIIEQTLASFGIESKVMEVMVGPSVTQYALDIALGIKVSKISNLRNDLALALATSSNSVRIEVPIPGTSYVGIEIPNTKRQPVFFREIISSSEAANPKLALAVTVGKGIAGNPIIGDIQKMPHLLIAGTTGSGKSVLTNSFIMSLLMKHSPDEVRFILVDPKQVELSDYNGIPHLLTPVITEMEKVGNALRWAVAEMERRYTIFREARVKNLEGYNEQQGFFALPYLVIVIDEMADMMLTAGRPEIETNIVRLAQKARATGIHLILATQRPSVNVITGLIKANIPGRIGMSVTTNTDSRVILDVSGAESLLGKGDLLFKEPDKNTPFRVQGVLVTQDEVQRVVGYIKDQTEIVEYIDEITAGREDENAGLGGAGGAGGVSGDNLFADAVRVIVSSQKGSASLLQRKLAIGYNRAAKLLDEMEEIGVVGAANGAKPRDVLITDAEGFLSQLNGGAQ